MLITARLCVERGYRAALCCPGCRTLRVFHTGFFQGVVRSGRGDEPLRALFDQGKLVCRLHGQPADFMTIDHDRDSTVDEIARWKKESPAVRGGAS